MTISSPVPGRTLTGRTGTPDARGPAVLHVVAPARVGGLERVVEQLAVGMRGRGYDHRVAAVLEPGAAARHPWLASLRRAGVPVQPIVVARRAYRAERATIAGLCRLRGVEVVHTHGFRPDIVDGGAARRAGCAVVSTVHGFTGGTWRVRLAERVQCWMLARADAVIAVSRPLAEWLDRRLPTTPIHLVPNPMPPSPPAGPVPPLRAAMGVPPGTVHVGWIGRMTREKGLDVLLAALEHLPDVPLHVSLVGDGPERRRLEGLGGPKVRWLGEVPGMADRLRAFDLIVLSSRTEGTPLVVMEALAAGVPVIGTAVGGVPDLLDHAGVLVPAERPGALATALRRAVDDLPRLRRRAARGGMRLRDTHGPARWLDTMADIYGTVWRPSA